MRLGLAFKVFWKTLADESVARGVEQVLAGEGGAVAKPQAGEGEGEAKPRAGEGGAPARSEALMLLAVLQREARFLDFVQEPMAGYSDAQVGAAVRDIHRDCAAVLERLFAPRPLDGRPEGSTVEVPAGYDPARVKLTGAVAGSPPFRGKLAHPGWAATRCALPAWTGRAEAALVVAPAEVEVG